MQKIKLIGISGTNGSGKDSLGQMLAERHGWLFISVTDILRDELKKRGLPIERENLRNLSAEWNRKNGTGVLTDMAIKKFQQAPGSYKGLAIASLRRESEAKRIHEFGGKMVWVDAEPEVRYKRVNGRNRGAEDAKSFEEFIAEEQAEMHNQGDKHAVGTQRVKEIADIFLTNNGTSIEEFNNHAEKALKDYI
jgi:dephospho-CoA kinase